jgi:hypothetical protein
MPLPAWLRHPPRSIPLVTGAIVVFAACSMITEPVCGCSQPYAIFVVSGVVQQTSGAPVADARISTIGIAAARDTVARSRWADLNGGARLVTDAQGRFNATLYYPSSGSIRVRVRVVRPASTDTVDVDFGTRRFRDDGRPDSASLVVVLP